MSAARGPFEMVFFVATLAVFIFFEWLGGTKRKLPELRDFSIIEGIKETVGRAVELDRPVMFLPGNAPTLTGDRAGMYLNSMNYLKYFAKECAAVGAKPIVTCPGIELIAHVDAIVEEAYRAAGKPEQYDRNYMLRYNEPMLTTIYREQTAGLINIGCETGMAYEIFPMQKTLGGITCGGTPRYTMMNSFVTGCDYLLIGDEFYGCSAKLSGDRHMIASVVGQDVLKYTSIALAVIVALAIAAQGTGIINVFLK